MKNYKIPLVYRTDITFDKNRNTKNVISFLSTDYYNENYYFNEDFPTNAYVFVFSIIPTFIRICLYPSIIPVSNAKKV